MKLYVVSTFHTDGQAIDNEISLITNDMEKAIAKEYQLDNDGNSDYVGVIDIVQSEKVSITL